MERQIRHVAALVALTIALLLPGLYFAAGLSAQRASLAAEGAFMAELVSNFINTNPELWEVDEFRLQSLLSRRPLERDAERREVVNLESQLVAQVSDPLASPTIVNRVEVHDAGKPVGAVRIERSVRPLIHETAWVSLAGLLLACSVYFTLKVLPLRALRRTVDSLLAEQRRSSELLREKAAMQAEKALMEERERLMAMQREKDAALAASDAKARFLATMSHEIRTPFNGVLGMIELLLKTGLDEQQRRMAETAYGSAEALLLLLNDILDFSKIESGKLTLERAPFDLHALVAEVATLLAPGAHGKGVELLFDVAPGVPRAVHGDSARLRQVLVNLVGNAVKFTDHGEVVMTVCTAGDGAGLKFSVRDTGIGISPESVARIFKPFTQADDGMSRRFGGTGLGLAISFELVAAMGGELNVESALGEGAAFSFTLVLPASPSVGHAPPPALAGRRVLLVGHTASSADIVSRQLAHLGLHVERAPGASDAHAALCAARRSGRACDAAVVDVRVAGLAQLLTALRGDATPGGIPVLALVTHASTADAQAAQHLGIDAHVTLPADPQALALGVLRLVGETTAAATGTIDPVMATTGARVLLVEDNPINRKVAVAMLERCGYVVETAENGRLGVIAAQRAAFDVVLMDCQMPEMDGFAATAALREREAADSTLRALPIIALTANAMAGDRERCLASGFDDYLSKPVKQRDLAATIERWLKTGSRSRAAAADLV